MTNRLSDKYERGLVAASMSALLEAELTLRSYHDSIVLVGGWAPYFLIKEYGRGDFQHIGSIDIDLAVDPDKVSQEEYATIVELLESRGYTMRRGKTGDPIQSSYIKEIISPNDGNTYKIHIDFLTAKERQGKHRYEKVQVDLPARVAAGCELAFRHKVEIEIEGVLPDGAETRTTMNTINIEGCLGMKGYALGNRYVEKDAYDIYSVITECLDDEKKVAERVKPFLEEQSMKRGIDNIRERFRSQTAEGPTWSAFFLEPSDKEMRKRVQAEAYARMKHFLRELEG